MGKSRKAGKRLTQKELLRLLQDFFCQHPHNSFSYKDIFRTLRLNTHPLKMLAVDVLEDLVFDDFIRREGNKVKLSDTYVWSQESQNYVRKMHFGVVGRKKDNDAVMHEILEEFDLPYEYPKEAEEAAKHIDATITEQDLREREDFRDVLTFTIDPADAKDFDDALSFRRKGTLYEVGVHIADVSHYVLPDSVIDREARKRATSVYLVDRTIPMLPERLCNFVCSLRPDEEKLCYSVIFDIDDDAVVHAWRLVHTVIKSNRRYAYEEVQEIINAVPSSPTPSPKSCEEAIAILNRLAQMLREQRFASGSVNLETEEMKFRLDDKGHPVAVYYKQSTEATQLVEEFMLLANRTVAESVGNPKMRTDGKHSSSKVLPYRIHEKPNDEKMDNLNSFIVKFGYKIKTSGTQLQTSRSLNKLMNSIHGKREQKLIQMLTLRSMMKAKYSTDNIGHFGLAYKYYTHFTSPIRRYPDTMVHRLLTLYQQGGKSGDKDYYEALCEHCSDMEVLATNAERASIKYKEVEFLSGKIGQEFDAHISGVTDFGFYCEIDENHCEGLVSRRELRDDHYEFDEKNFCLRGRKYNNTYSLGDPVRIVVAKTNFNRRLIDFALA